MGRSTPGNYVPLDVNYLRDSAIRMAGPDAELLYIRSLAFAKGSKTDGLIASFDLDVVGVGLKKLQQRAAALVKHDLWVECPEGWLIRSWHRWNDAALIESQAGALAAHTRWHVNLDKRNEDCEFCRKGDDEPPDGDAAADAPAMRSHYGAHTPTDANRTKGKGREGKGTISTCGSSFAEFWSVYPRKAGKQDAEKAFNQQRRTTDAGVIIAGAVRLAADPNLPAARFIPHPSTWLRAGQWDDDPLPERGEGKSPSDQRAAHNVSLIERYAEQDRKAIG